MKSTSSLTFIAASVLLAARSVTSIALNTSTPEGCFSSGNGLTYNSTYLFQTPGWCQPLCVQMGQSVFATTNSTDCWCGNLLPPASSKVDDNSCNDPCAGFDIQMCGGVGFFSVYLSGTTDKVANADASVESSTTSTTTPPISTSVKPSVVTVGGQTIVVTATGSVANASTSSSSLPSSSSSSSKGSSKTGIAAGVVVGIVAISAIVGGAFLFFRNRKRREVEEEYRRNAAVSSFISGGKPPTSSGGVSLNDTRLDPSVMAQRRMSDGSIADNQDYSRRILKVTNA